MRNLSLLITILFLSSCARQSLILNVGPVTYGESLKYHASSSLLTSDINIEEEVELKGSNLELGIGGENKYFFIQFLIFKGKYEDDTVDILGSSTDLGLESSGHQIKFGVKLFSYIQPFVFSGQTEFTYKVNGNSDSEKYDSNGFGINLEYPMSKRLHFVLGYSKAASFNSESTYEYSGGNYISEDLDQEFFETRIYAGLKFFVPKQQYAKRGGGGGGE